MKKKIIVILSIILFSILLMLFFIQNNKNNIQLKLNTERIIEDSLVLDKTFKLDKKLSVMKLVSNDLYFVSWTKNNQGKLFKYNINNNFSYKEINLNQKEDTLMIIGSYVVKGDTIYYHDKIKNSIVKSMSNGKILKSYKYPKQFSRTTKVNNHFIVSGWDDKYNIYFDKFNFETENISKISLNDDYLNQYKNNGITLDGVYYSNENFTAMLPYSVNRLFLFNNDFIYKGKIDLIYGKLDFNYRDTEDKSIYIDPNNLNPNLSCFIDDSNFIYILTDHSTQWSNSNKCFIDVYNLTTKKYVKSYKINDFDSSKPRHIIKYKSKIIVLFEKDINIYKIN